jgi:hypothetical protein
LSGALENSSLRKDREASRGRTEQVQFSKRATPLFGH